MNRRYFGVLLISVILFAAVVPLAITFSNPSVGVDSFGHSGFLAFRKRARVL